MGNSTLYDCYVMKGQNPFNNTQYRYFDLRYEGERTISGTALEYGDVATFPWGDSERFESGCFGNVSNLDLSLNCQHDRSTTIARTGGAGLDVTDSPTRLEIRAELDEEDPDAVRALRKVRGRRWRGLSIEFRPDKYRMESLPNGKIEIVHTKAVLRGFGVVDRPEYKKSTVQAREEFREAFMADGGISKEEVQRMIDDTQKRAGAEPTTTTLTMDTAAVTKAVSEAVTTEVRTMVEGVSTRLKAVEDAMPTDDDRALSAMEKKKKDEEMAEKDKAKKKRTRTWLPWTPPWKPAPP